MLLIRLSMLGSLSDDSVRHWDRLFDSSPIKGEGIMAVGLACFHPALWILP